jgi:ribulose-phosphate 3-epimerase
MTQIAPSILAAKFEDLDTEVKALEAAGADMLHIDVMDGEFVEAKTEFLDPNVTKRIRSLTNITLDAHLMVTKPEDYVDQFIEAGADIITLHIESQGDIPELLNKIKLANKKPGISINPDTEIEKVLPLLKDCYMVLVMSVYPGKCGQGFIENSIEKIKQLKQYIKDNNLQTLIQVDGGIKAENAYKVIEVGADILVSGSGVLGKEDYKEVMDKMRCT